MLESIDIIRAAMYDFSPRNTFAALLLRLTTRQARGLLSLTFLDPRTVRCIRVPAERLDGICCVVHGDGTLIVDLI